MRESTRKGTVSETLFSLVCLELGYDLAKPLMDDGYDYVLRRENIWETVQVKTATYRSVSDSHKYPIVDLTNYRKERVIGEYLDKFDLLGIVYERDVWLLPTSSISNIRYISAGKKIAKYKLT